MAELADALGSGPSDRKIVEVQVLSSALRNAVAVEINYSRRQCKIFPLSFERRIGMTGSEELRIAIIQAATSVVNNVAPGTTFPQRAEGFKTIYRAIREAVTEDMNRQPGKGSPGQ